MKGYTIYTKLHMDTLYKKAMKGYTIENKL